MDPVESFELGEAGFVVEVLEAMEGREIEITRGLGGVEIPVDRP